jgi:hypothetical protein
MLDQGLRCPLKAPRYAYIAPTYTQAKRVAWDYLKDFTKNFPGREVREQELRIDIPRPDKGDTIRYMLFGADNADSIRGIYLDGCILDEYAQCSPDLWGQTVRPFLADRKGWAIFIGTPKGQNHFFDMYKLARKLAKGEMTNDDIKSMGFEDKTEAEIRAICDEWFTTVQPASRTGIVPRSELDASRAAMAEEEYEQEFECSFTAAMVGAYYGKQMEAALKEGRICNVPWERNLPVHTYWDLGVNDTTCIWFLQMVGKEYHLIDYYEMSGEDIPHYVSYLNSKPYIYGEHVLPHDGNARELGTGRTRQETFRSLGVRTRILPKHNPQDGINACRLILPKCYFDESKCERGIDALRNYEKKWDTKNKIFQVKPLHNWASNGADAFRILAMGTRSVDNGLVGNYSDKNKLPRKAIMGYDFFGGFNEL